MTDQPETDYEPQTAMLLTETEWLDLALMVEHYKNCCQGSACHHQANPTSARLRQLADRIIEAAKS
jgi:hypothetical protein